MHMAVVNVADEAFWFYQCKSTKLIQKKGQPIWLPKSFFVGSD